MSWKKIKGGIDFKDAEYILSKQQKLMQRQLEYVSKYSPYYKNLFSKSGIHVSEIKTLADLKLIPTTTKRDLGEHNHDFFAATPKQIVEFVTTSGTTGRPVSIALTENDIARLTYNEARSLQIAGLNEDDIVQITTTLDKRFMAGMAYYLGLKRLGAASIRIGHGHPQFHWDTALEFSPSAIVGVPSFLAKLGQYGKEHGIKGTITKAICIGEPVREADFSDNVLAANIKKHWPIELYSTYASTEMATAFTECSAKQGGHLLPELTLFELLDKDGNEVEDGQLGEVTVTPLGVEGTPLVRFRTGDLARKHAKHCSCGRTTLRLGPIEGRKELMIKYKGTTIFPQQIENILHRNELSMYVLMLTQNKYGLDEVEIYLSDSLNHQVVDAFAHEVRSALRVMPIIKLIPKKELNTMLFPLGSRKPMKIQDNRNA